MWAVVLAGVAGGCAAAQQGVAKRPMTFADLMAMKRVSDPQVSPGGKWVMFSVTDVSLEKNTKVNHLWVVPLAGGAERQVTSGAGETNGRFAPDGSRVSFTADDAAGQSQIMLAAWDEAAGTVAAGRALTAIATGADGAVWSPDSKRVLFVSSVYPECSLTTTWAEEEACDAAKDAAAAANPVKAQVWDHLLYRHWNAFTGEKRSHVLVVSAADGTAVRDLTPAGVVGDAETPTFSLGGPLGYAWAPDSKEIAYVTNLDKVPAASTNNDVFTLRLDEAGAKAVKVSTSPGSDDEPQYSPDGKWLAFRSQARAGFESDRFRLMVFDRAGKTVKELLPKFDRWVDEFVWAPDSSSIYFAAGDEGAEPVYVMHMPGSRNNILPSVTQLTQNGEGDFGSLTVSADGKHVLASQMRLDQPAELSNVDAQGPPTIMDGVVIKTKAGEATPPSPAGVDTDAYVKVDPLTHANGVLTSSLSLRDADSFWFTGAQNTRVEGFIVRPPNFDPSRKYPMKFLIHGGPQGAWGDAWSYRWNPELMAASGYVVVMVNPRGSTGYGQKFVDEVSGDWGGRAYIDLMKGLDAAEAKFPFIDKTRECALGASYGGYMANWMLTHTTRFACIVTHDGMYNPAAAYGDTEEVWFNEWEFRRARDFPSAGNPGRPAEPWRYAAGPVEDDPFRKWSPMLHIQDAKTPTLVIHSQRDYRLDVSEGMQLFTALQRLGVPSKMLYFPDEGHWVLKPRNSELWNATVSDWCDRWTHTGKYAAGQ